MAPGLGFARRYVLGPATRSVGIPGIGRGTPGGPPLRFRHDDCAGVINWKQWVRYRICGVCDLIWRRSPSLAATQVNFEDAPPMSSLPRSVRPSRRRNHRTWQGRALERLEDRKLMDASNDTG